MFQPSFTETDVFDVNKSNTLLTIKGKGTLYHKYGEGLEHD